MTETNKDTGVGSYFVSNYPPYSFWKKEYSNTAQEMLVKPVADKRNLGFYLHIPFCRKRCKFCYFRVYTDKNKKQREDYIYNLVKELELYANSPVVADRLVNFFYIGGGTPSALSAEQIEYLGEQLRRIFPHDGVQEITFECEPGTLTEKKLSAIKNFGTTRLSLGVENFSDEILKENGRAHLSEEIHNAYKWVQELDFPQVNIDLISGMVGETQENWQECINKTIDLRPSSVTIYQMELPFNSIYAKQILGEEGICRVATWETKRRWAQDAFDQFKKIGYKQSSAYTVVLPSDKQSFCYRDQLWYGADMIGTGVASFSHVQGIHYQNVDKFETYMEKCENKELPIHRAFPTNDRQRLIRELILRMKLGYLKRQEFLDKFSVDIISEFADQFSALEKRGMLVENEQGVELTTQGLLQVDSLLPNFYDPEYQNARYT
ncbi:coproporphyrinogen-III oxidase family protein [Candidatus Uabimicrobium sp. HlEnr_7]|uniref:coproporphyrinogen-III oxidase family protein n=1 Tax=Candidatus Uabimicrobium helgolandensis TaxID=3095367 RepID=UPI0035574A95